MVLFVLYKITRTGCFIQPVRLFSQIDVKKLLFVLSDLLSDKCIYSLQVSCPGT